MSRSNTRSPKDVPACAIAQSARHIPVTCLIDNGPQRSRCHSSGGRAWVQEVLEWAGIATAVFRSEAVPDRSPRSRMTSMKILFPPMVETAQ